MPLHLTWCPSCQRNSNLQKSIQGRPSYLLKGRQWRRVSTHCRIVFLFRSCLFALSSHSCQSKAHTSANCLIFVPLHFPFSPPLGWFVLVCFSLSNIPWDRFSSHWMCWDIIRMGSSDSSVLEFDDDEEASLKSKWHFCQTRRFATCRLRDCKGTVRCTSNCKSDSFNPCTTASSSSASTTIDNFSINFKSSLSVTSRQILCPLCKIFQLYSLSIRSKTDYTSSLNASCHHYQRG